MTHSDYTRNILNIKDENIYFLKNCLESKKIKGIETKIFYGILTYKPDFCPCCGVINQSHNDIIKWGFKHNCKVKIPKLSNYNALLILSKQRFLCKHCRETFTCESSLVNKYCNISNNSSLSIKIDLMTKSSEKDIAKRHNVSVSKVDEILSDISSDSILTHEHLPSEMNFDEFKATKDTKSKMAFIITDNSNHSIFDILDSRYSSDLEKYFKRYSKKQRDNVKLISIDMYKPYVVLSRNLFKNACIVIDRFHIVLQAYNALNITRVKYMKEDKKNYNKLKYFWRLILKNEKDLSHEKFFSKHFNKYISPFDVVQYLINLDATLKATYECYQGLINSINNKDFNKFVNIISHCSKNISVHMKKAIKTYNKFLPYIKNSFIYDINNGVIEGTNNLIKCIKRIAFGYRKFKHFRARILLIKGIISYEM